jgi:hypothetical protein
MKSPVKISSTSVFREMRRDLLSLQWCRICWGEVRASRTSSGLQGRYRLARNSHLAASRSHPDVCARSPFIGRTFPAEPRHFPEFFPHGSQSRARHISSSIASAAAEAGRSHSVATFCVATKCRAAPPAGDTTCCRSWRRHFRRRRGRHCNSSCAEGP